jgi:hypothetical protein
MPSSPQKKDSMNPYRTLLICTAKSILLSMNNLRSLEFRNILKFASSFIQKIYFCPIDWQLIVPTVTLGK